jgi:hypothetical protein
MHSPVPARRRGASAGRCVVEHGPRRTGRPSRRKISLAARHECAVPISGSASTGPDQAPARVRRSQCGEADARQLLSPDGRSPGLTPFSLFLFVFFFFIPNSATRVDVLTSRALPTVVIASGSNSPSIGGYQKPPLAVGKSGNGKSTTCRGTVCCDGCAGVAPARHDHSVCTRTAVPDPRVFPGASILHTH